MSIRPAVAFAVYLAVLTGAFVAVRAVTPRLQDLYRRMRGQDRHVRRMSQRKIDAEFDAITAVICAEEAAAKKESE